MTDKFCEGCSSVLVRRKQETRSQWERRRFCNQRCYGMFRTATRRPSTVNLGRLRGLEPTDREMQVIQLVASGLSNPQIGTRLGLSPLTVKGHLMRIGVKFGVADRAGIVGAAIRGGYLRVPVTRKAPDGFGEDLFDVLVRIARGRSNAEIGAELGLSYETVKARVRRLLLVLGVRCREEAVTAGFACGALRLVPVRRPERVAA